MKQDFNLPDIFYLDLWPLGPCFLLLTSPDAAAIPTTASNFPMPDVVTKSFDGNVGTTFIEATNGPLWKYLMQQLAPGLNPAAVKTFSHSIIDHARALHGRLEHYADMAQIINIQSVLGEYPFQVVATVFFGERLSEQAYKDTTRMVDLMLIKNSAGALINPVTKWRWKKDLDSCLSRLEGEIKDLVYARYAALQEHQGECAATKTPTLLDRMLLPRVQSQQPLDNTHLKLILENAKGFIVAGYGTAVDTSTYIWMLLSAFPEVLTKLREEHDRIFHPDFDRTLVMLHENPKRIRNLHYTTAIIHETLRLFPIGMTARQAPPDLTMLEHKGAKYPLLKDHLLGIMTQSIHYDPEVFEDPKRFRPERFLCEDRPVLRNAYRPFERGVRACIGQTLAMDELKISLVMLARWFEFELVDHEPAKEPLFTHTDLDTKLGKHEFQVHAFTAMAAGSVKMRIRRAGMRK
uniref:Cytochrome P450 n=1 Tax=Bionectria ochroleuca TaxID=29856 RepID=A0A8H7KBD1_BIOOC